MRSISTHFADVPAFAKALETPPNLRRFEAVEAEQIVLCVRRNDQLGPGAEYGATKTKIKGSVYKPCAFMLCFL